MAPIRPRKRSSLRTRVHVKGTHTHQTPTATSPSSSAQQPSRTKHLTSSNPSRSTGHSIGDKSPFAINKRDKQTIRSSAFRSRIEKASTAPSKKRRRPNKKLVTTLESLADALPDLDIGQGKHDIENAVSGEQKLAEINPLGGMVKIQQRSLTSKPGAMKRKELLERRERERFGKNMASMVGATRGSDVGAITEVGGKNATSAPAERPSIAEAEIEGQVATADRLGPPAVKSGADTASKWAALRNFISQTLEQREPSLSR